MSFSKLLTSKTLIVLLLLVLPSIFLLPTWFREQGLWDYMDIFYLPVVVPTVIIPIRYIQAHTQDPPEKYFMKFGAKRAIKDYVLSIRFLYVTIIVPVVWFSINIWYQTQINFLSFEPLFLFSVYVWYMILISITLTIKLAWQHSRNDFDFYLAKAYYIVGSLRQDDLGKFRSLVLLLDTYNKFLERNLKLKIKDIMRIHSRIMTANPEKRTMIGESIRRALEKDKLELARQLAEISSLPETEHFLTREPRLLNQRFKELLAVIIPAIISIPVSIIGLLTQAMNLKPPT